MNYVIENKDLKVEITDLGAELQSIYGKKTGTEYLWQGDENLWKNRATVLFPICGRLYTGKYTWKGNEYEMPLHGFVKLVTFEVESKTETKVVFTTSATDESKKMYPFEFTFKVSYELIGNTLKVEQIAINDEEEVLPCSTGGHPGFNIPFIKGEKFEDYYVEFNEPRKVTRIETSPTVFFTGNNNPYPLKDDKIIELKHDLFDNDAIFLTGMSDSVSIKSKTNDRKITVSYTDMTHVGFWHSCKTQAPFVCVEPWHGIPSYDGKVDDFATKNEMLQLKKGEKYTLNYNITVTE